MTTTTKSPQAMSSDSTATAADAFRRRVGENLQHQYEFTRDYCNALTAVHNALTKSKLSDNNTSSNKRDQRQSLSNAYRELQSKRTRLQNQVQMYHGLVEEQGPALLGLGDDMPSSSEFFTLLRDHGQRWTRVLATIYGSTGIAQRDSLGLPLATDTSIEDDQSTFLIALATLQASIDTVKELLVQDSTE